METWEAVKAFFDYLIIDDDGWKGVRTDSPEEVKKAYMQYELKQRKFEIEHIKQ